MSDRLPSPGPSFVRTEVWRPREGTPAAADPGPFRPGMAAPSVMDDGWWLTHLWLEDAEGIVSVRSLAPLSGPPPGPPLATIGPALAGALAGLLDQEDGRQLIRLRMPPAEDETRPWERPLIIATAVRWDPVRAATMRHNEIARELLRAFLLSLDAAGARA